MVQLVGKQVTTNNLLEALRGMNTIYTYNFAEVFEFSRFTANRFSPARNAAGI